MSISDFAAAYTFGPLYANAPEVVNLRGDTQSHFDEATNIAIAVAVGYKAPLTGRECPIEGAFHQFYDLGYAPRYF